MAWSNYATICRLCLQQDGFLLAIFNNHVNDNVNNSIHRKIVECTALELSSGDGLPPCICHRCLYKLELCLEFKQQCLMSDATLRQVTHPNGERNSDQESEDTHYQPTTVSAAEFEKFNQKFIPDHGQNAENVVMVVNPDLEYDSDSESGNHSDVENIDTAEFTELKNVFMCKYCDRAYTDREACRNHESNEHNTEVPFMCSQCDMSFADRTNYTAHLKSVHANDKPFGCPQCPRSFSRRSDLRKHTVVHTGIKPFTCNICFKSFSRNTNLTKHLRIHSGDKPYVCPQCPKTFISKGDLTRHALIHSGHKPFACNYCNQSFGRRDKLIRHEKKHFPNNEDRPTSEPFSCNFCNQSFARRDKLLRHEKKHFPNNEDRSSAVSELELLRQQIALSGYPYETAVKQEVQEEEPDEEDKWGGENMVISVDPFNHEENYSSVDMSRSQTDDDLPRIPDHIQNDTNDLPRIPEHITGDEYEFDPLKKQMKHVSSIRKYICFVCHKRFLTQETLRSHQNTHSQHKPHVCPQCSKSFLRKRELDRHMTTHSGTKPFKCTHCEKRFGRKDKLVRHMRIHNIGDHVCPVCSTRFVRRESLAVHMKVHANTEEKTQ